MREKIELARNFGSLSDGQKQALIEKVKTKALEGTIEYFKRKEA
ncbi:hypothetical protein [Gaoshiqia sediminis]|uniref:Uncharacterized protein n=1 Tax=Gaoshiqia sediminis TaxID=2986998 RepID=A0AA41Y5V6_9BACT|nr:hypothetical protein [Gaoshiqia sediminis]MCW0483981.1 hypothetical protein [Gaoshiqia sediminis]